MNDWDDHKLDEMISWYQNHSKKPTSISDSTNDNTTQRVSNDHYNSDQGTNWMETQNKYDQDFQDTQDTQDSQDPQDSVNLPINSTLTILNQNQTFQRWLERTRSKEESEILERLEQLKSENSVSPIIHQITDHRSIPESILAWKALHPTWEYFLWDSPLIDHFISRYYPYFLPLYNSFKYPRQKLDLGRICILHRYGGIYADLNLKPVIPMDTFFNHGKAVYLLRDRNNFRFTNILMGSTANHDFWLEVAKEMEKPYMPWWTCMRHFHLLYSTGPYLLDRVAQRWKGSIVLLPSLSTCSYCEIEPKLGSYIEIQEWEHEPWDSKLTNVSIQNWKKIFIVIVLLILLLIVWLSR